MGRLTLLALLLASLLAFPAAALAHGDEDAGMQDEEAEVAELAKQPARVLAQQAHALLHIRDDRGEAAVRLDAAVESRDTREVDMPTLRRAMETLDDGGGEREVLDLIDTALSKPLGASSGKLFHGSGREFRSARSAQEIVGIAAGAVLLALGAGALLAHRRRTPVV